MGKLIITNIILFLASVMGLSHASMMQYMSTDEAILFFKIVDPYRLNFMRFNQNVMGGQKYGFIDSTASK